MTVYVLVIESGDGEGYPPDRFFGLYFSLEDAKQAQYDYGYDDSTSTILPFEKLEKEA